MILKSMKRREKAGDSEVVLQGMGEYCSFVPHCFLNIISFEVDIERILEEFLHHFSKLGNKVLNLYFISNYVNTNVPMPNLDHAPFDIQSLLHEIFQK